MTNILTNLMVGGDVGPDYGDAASQFELWLEDRKAEAESMSIPELEDAHAEAKEEKDETMAEIYERELSKRGFSFEAVPAPDATWYQDDPDHEDRRKDYLENYAAYELERDELPF